MKKILYLSFIALMFSCSTNKGEGVIEVKVSLPEIGTNFISWLDIFPDVEMIALSGEQAPAFGSYSSVFVHNNNYYIAELEATNKVYRFDQNGLYLNSIGSQGRGPEEYSSIYYLIVDDNGNVVVYPYGEGFLVTYSKDGTFMEKRELSYWFQRFFIHKEHNYYNVGVKTDQEYQLYVTNNNGEAVGEFLPQPPSAPLSFPNTQTFSLYDDVVYFCPSEDNGVYRLKNGEMEMRYHFDFGINNIPEEYYQRDDIRDVLARNSIVLKDAFFESSHCAVLQVMIQGAVELEPTFAVGVFDKKKNIWKWFNIGWENSYIYFPYMYFDEEYAYFLASAELMREDSGLKERFPLLNTITGNDTVILKCKTESIKL